MSRLNKNDLEYKRKHDMTVNLFLKCGGTLSISQLMKAAGFNDEQCASTTLRQRIRRDKRLEKSPPPNVSSTSDTSSLLMSPLTESSALSSASSSVSSSKKRKQPLPGFKAIRKTAPQAQQDRENKKAFEENKKNAHKKATLLYDQERNKSDGNKEEREVHK